MARTRQKVAARIRVQAPAGQANPAPPLGPALGQHGVNIAEFCKMFNARTQSEEPGVKLTASITVYADRSFSFVFSRPLASTLLKQAAGVDKGSSTPNSAKVGRLTRAQLEELVRVKEPDLTAADLDAGVRTLAGSARSMGITVEGV